MDGVSEDEEGTRFWISSLDVILTRPHRENLEGPVKACYAWRRL